MEEEEEGLDEALVDEKEREKVGQTDETEREGRRDDEIGPINHTDVGQTERGRRILAKAEKAEGERASDLKEGFKRNRRGMRSSASGLAGLR